MNNQIDDNIYIDEQLKKKSRESHPLTRKSRSISRYFLGNKHSSIDLTTDDINITHCLTSIGIFDSYDLWTNVILFHDYRTYRRLFIITNKNQLIISKLNQKQSLLKIKHRIDLNRLWLYTNIENINESIISEITSLTYYDYHRTLIIGWPLVENFLVEFDTKDIRDIWYKRIQSTLNFWWQLNSLNIEHVRIVIDQNQEYDQNNNTTSFLIRKVISIQPQETVRDLIKKCIDACHLRDSCVDNYILFVLNDSNIISNTNQLVNSSLQSNQIQLIPLIGHEYPYAIKMKHLKTSNHTSFDNDDYLSLHNTGTIYSQHNNSTTSLNNISINSHDFELRKRDIDNQNKKYRFFHKRKTKDHHTKSLILQQQYNDDYYSSSSTTTTTNPLKIKSSNQFFGQTFDELFKKYNNQLPPIIQKLLEILYFKGPETTGIFRKVANTRSVKDSIDKIERNILLQDEDLHPILAAGIFKHFLRTLPEPVFNTIQYDNWKKCLRLPIIQEKISFARKSIISTLSDSNYILLKGFICILHHISQNADTNGMNPFNLGLCVSNSLFKTESTTIASGKQEADVMSSIVEFLIVNCTSLFGSDILTCIPDKHIIVHHIPNLTRPTASSIESLDEVESSPHLHIFNRSRDSGLATSDQPLNDDSSEISEYFRRNTSIPPNWTTSISCGIGTVLSSIILPTTILTLNRYRNSKNLYKPSKQFMERKKLTNDTTDESDHDEFNGTIGDSSVRSSTTTVNNISIGKIKRSKPISRHSSLGNNEYYQKSQQHHQQHQQQQQQLTKESKRLLTNDVKRASSLKQFHHLSDEADDDDEQNKTLNFNNNNNNNINIKKKTSIMTKKNEQILSSTSLINSKNLTNERRSKLIKSKAINSDEESITTRSTQFEQQDLDLTSEPLSTINQRLTNVSTIRSASFNVPTTTTTTTTTKTFDSSLLNTQTSLSIDYHSRKKPIIIDGGRSRHNGPLTATTNQIYTSTHNEHHSQTNSNTQIQSERDRTFIHHSNCRPFKLGTAVQMKPIDDLLLTSSNGRRRPCHRQNALRYKSIDQEHNEKQLIHQSTPIIINQNRLYSNENSSTHISRYQSIERRTPITQSTKSFSFDINDELRPCDISWSVREKAKLFEHNKLSTGRENYV
ncbi:unnamed protein product [Rotaria sordida]|uniref:Rho-GAP domain-containing protein n=1 Tax=Rotaria sordida TaxID=392033 RepID=A0A819LR56_9BILA|nr:unnamed protein product [Rotaria sordida]